MLHLAEVIQGILSVESLRSRPAPLRSHDPARSKHALVRWNNPRSRVCAANSASGNHRKFFRFFHRTHHLSTNPTPWAAFAFSSAEALVQAAIFPLAVLLMPLHPLAFAVFLFWQMLFNVIDTG